MKKSDINDIKNKPKDELQKMVFELKGKLREAAFDLEAGKLKNVNSIKNLRRDIARVLTFLNTNK